MTSQAIPRIADRDMLARFVLFPRWVRPNGSVKPDAFQPPSDLELSVTRHSRLTEIEIWSRGGNVVEKRTASSPERPASLLGRADISAGAVRDVHGLDAIEAPQEENPEHSHIVGWPVEKAARISAAQRLAAASLFVPCPAGGRDFSPDHQPS